MRDKFFANSGDVYLTGCYFTGYGKAINCTGSVNNILIESCIFYNVYDDSRAGCIFIECKNHCTCKIVQCCGNKCFSRGYSFAFLFSDTRGLCVLQQTSVTECGEEKSGGVVVCFVRGSQQISHLNGSSNIADSFIFEHCSGNQENLSKFCSFVKNRANICCLFCLTEVDGKDGTYLITECNFVSNKGSKSSSTTVCILESDGILTVQKSIFVDNNARYLFRADDGGKIIVTNCYIPNDSITNVCGIVSITNLITDSQTYQIPHLNTQFCPADFNDQNQLNPIIIKNGLYDLYLNVDNKEIDKKEIINILS